MIRINENYTKLKASYLFADIARRVGAYAAAHPDKAVIRLGIGDVTEPLPPASVAALHAALLALRWRWRLDQPLPLADLTRKSGDDVAVKVCAMFDLPLTQLGLIERNLLRLARSVSHDYLPAATLCYVWDNKLPVGTELPNAFTHRVRYVVLNSGTAQLKQWVTHERNLNADFLRTFGHESEGRVPPLMAILVGADSDTTDGSSLAYASDLVLKTSP